MSKKILLIGGGIALVCIACIAFAAIIGGGVFFLTKQVADAGDEFLRAVKAEDYEAAFALTDPSLHNEIPDAEALEAFFVGNGFYPQSWTFNSRNIDNNRGSLSGSVTLTNGVKLQLEMNFIKVDGDWQLTGIHFRDN